MKILLLGDFSSLHKNLKEGLVELGHDVKIISSGDGWKEIETDIDIGTKKRGIIGKLEKFFKLICVMPKLKNYDVVQLISSEFFPNIFQFNKFIMRYIFKNNRKVFCVCAGCNDPIIADYLENKFKYPQLYQEIKKFNKKLWCQTRLGRSYHKWIADNINGYIPIVYEYAEGFRILKHKKLCPTIHLPINIKDIKYKKNSIGQKIVFFHGLNRDGVKGTPIIQEALKRLKNNYPDDVEVIIDGKMPLREYLKFLEKVNVVIDQIYSASIGMNALYNLAMGKIIVGGGEKESLDELNIQESPIISIQPNIEDIYKKLEAILNNKNKIEIVGYESRKYVEKYHDYSMIAQQYLSTWERY
ncbi:MAG: hypothetical protein WCY75_07865 [Sulfurimonadaceae bacterium]|nr:glycosyltransferase [Candidatus Cloacimonadota bacterium]